MSGIETVLSASLPATNGNSDMIPGNKAESRLVKIEVAPRKT